MIKNEDFRHTDETLVSQHMRKHILIQVTDDKISFNRCEYRIFLDNMEVYMILTCTGTCESTDDLCAYVIKTSFMYM